MQTDLIKIDSAPAKLGANFEEVRKRLEQELAKYDVVVTADGVADAKKLTTELNQTAKHIDERRKAEVAAVSEPIKQFDDQMRELVTMCKDGRQKLLDQVKQFEDETREKALQLLTEHRDALWEEKQVEAEFRRATVDDLVKLSAVTKSETLAAASRRDVEARVNDDLALQQRTESRLESLNSTSEWAGLPAPLTRDHVAGFLFADEQTWQAELTRITNAEVERQKETERRATAKAEQEQREREEAAQREREAAEQAALVPEEAQEAEEVQDPLPWEGPDQFDAPATDDEAVAPAEAMPCATAPRDEDSEAAPATIQVLVTATFAPTVPARATDKQIAAALRQKMEDAGFDTLKSIEVTRG